MAVLDPVSDADAIQQHYDTVIATVNIINGIIAGTVMTGEPPLVRQSNIDSGVLYLKDMVDRPYWTTHDMTSVPPAIVAGENYVAT